MANIKKAKNGKSAKDDQGVVLFWVLWIFEKKKFENIITPQTKNPLPQAGTLGKKIQ